ncbi:MAG: cellulose biosynthesis cyclic di-GMP-binding regulatory protein BcsB [Desulfobacteraceae bacterium]|nr:cellulose biosynthesis cyclic di-GMP-binding regulatory protein BcsB [Desulfobacteraceae bacterium]
MIKKYFAVLFVFLFWIPAAINAKVITIPLKNAVQVDTIRLINTSSNTDRYDFKLPIPQRWQVKNARLTFSYTNSSALIKARSKLSFLFEKIPLAQVSLDPLSPKNIMTVTIPGHLLKPGYHPFGFEVSQHSVEDGCEDHSAPELWTVLELNTAMLEINYTLKKIPLRLSAINDFLFDSKNPRAPSLGLLYKDLEPDIMKAISLSAAGIAIRYDYRASRFFSSDTIEKGRDSIIIATPENARSLLGSLPVPKQLDKVTGPHLSIHYLPVDDDNKTDTAHALILVSGRTNAEILTAAKAFSLISLPLPDTQSLQIQDIQVPAIEPNTHKNGLLPGYMYSFASLEFASTTFKGMNPVSKGFNFWIPSDSHLTPNSQAILSLNLAYGAAMREDSVLNIQLNGKFVAAIPCNDPKGGTYQSYKVRLRMSSMKQGFNEIIFAPKLTPLIMDQCKLIQTGNLRVTLFGNSTFILPEVDQWIEMPNLFAFVRDGFPFCKQLDMRDTTILIPDRSRSSFMAAVNLVALASQKSGFPPLNSKWAFNFDKIEDKDIIIVSIADSLPEQFQRAAPLQIVTPGPFKYPHLGRAKGIKTTNTEGFFSTLLPPRQTHITDIAIRKYELILVSAAPVLTQGRAALMEFQSPFNRDRTILALTTHTKADMKKVADSLWKTDFQASLKGDTALIDLVSKNPETFSIKLGSSYYLGKISSIPLLDYYANTYPLWFIGVVLSLCIVLAYFIYRLLKKRKQRRFSDE